MSCEQNKNILNSAQTTRTVAVGSKMHSCSQLIQRRQVNIHKALQNNDLMPPKLVIAGTAEDIHSRMLENVSKSEG